MDKFTKIKSNNLFNYKYLSFFVYNGKAYNVGSVVHLNKNGGCALGNGDSSNIIKATIEDCYLNCKVEHWVFRIYLKNHKYGSALYDWDRATAEKFIESIEAKPLDNSQEYINYLEKYQDEYYNNNLTSAEWDKISYAVKNNIPVEVAVPDRLKEKYNEAKKEISSNTKIKPLFKDWEITELVLAWILYIVFFFFSFVFKDWYIRVILQVSVGWLFGSWRQKKVWGIK